MKEKEMQERMGIMGERFFSFLGFSSQEMKYGKLKERFFSLPY
jgi:hypothetical protein